MSFWRSYLRSKRKSFGLFVCLAGTYFVTFLLYRLPLKAVLYPTALCLFFLLLYFVREYRDRKERYELLCLMEQNFPAAYTKMPEAENAIERQYQILLRSLHEEQMGRLQIANEKYSDMLEYYTMWVHQIKTPIASMRLLLAQEDSDNARRMAADLNRIEQYVSMVLAYLRLGSDARDLVIRECDIDTVLNPCIRRFAPDFIGRRITLRYEPIHETVVTDEKWLGFCVEQILSNSLKYTNSGTVTIAMEEGVLCIRDTGIGIDSADLPRIFEKGYTGFNGRSETKASGLGLYLCRRVCDMLGMEISVESQVGEGTALYLAFGKPGVDFRD